MKENGGVILFVKTVLFGVLSAAGAALLLIIAGALVSLGSSNPESLVIPIGCGALACSVFVGGVVSGRLGEKVGFSGVATSAVAGVFQVLLMFLLTVLPVEPFMNPNSLLRLGIYTLVVLLSLLGGVIGRPRERKHSHYPKKHKRR